MYQAMDMKLISDAAGLQDEELKALAVIGEELICSLTIALAVVNLQRILTRQ